MYSIPLPRRPTPRATGARTASPRPLTAAAIGMEVRQGRASVGRGSVRSTTTRPEGIAQIRAGESGSPAMHVDETSLRVEGKNHWIHVYSAGTLTVKCLHPKRGREAIEAIGILPRYAGVAVHDCWASYLSYEHCDHALCGAHLLRELTFIVDAHGYAWANRMKRLLLGACHQVSKRDDKTLSASEYKALRKRYRTILTQGARELPPIPPRQNGQRGKVAKSDAHNLWERMQKHETAVLRFAKHPDVAFTNNRAERDLRMSKVKQKVSGCFRTRKYAEAYCRISSYLQSMASQGYNPLVAIQIALAGRAVDYVGE